MWALEWNQLRDKNKDITENAIRWKMHLSTDREPENRCHFSLMISTIKILTKIKNITCWVISIPNISAISMPWHYKNWSKMFDSVWLEVRCGSGYIKFWESYPPRGFQKLSVFSIVLELHSSLLPLTLHTDQANGSKLYLLKHISNQMSPSIGKG